MARNSADKLVRLVNWKGFRLWNQGRPACESCPCHFSSLGYLSIYTWSFLYKIGAIDYDVVFYSKIELLKSMFGLRG